MNAKAIHAELVAFSGTDRMVRLTRNRPSEPHLSGFVVAVTPELVLLRQFHDFNPEGYAVVLTRDVTAVRSGKYERHWERMLEGEGISGAAALGVELPLESAAAGRRGGLLAAYAEH